MLGVHILSIFCHIPRQCAVCVQVFGGQGANDLRDLMSHDDVVFVAHCNVSKARRESIKQTIDDFYKSDIDTYIDFRELLARKDVDAVLITTGDRSHAMLSVKAMRAGKDVYCEKPGSLTIQEGQVLAETQKRYGRVYQGGMQRLNESNFIFANELYRLGRLGKVSTVHAQIMSGNTYMTNNYLPADVLGPPKEEFWWDAWLGPHPWRPYNSRYSSGSNLHDLDFYNSNIGEWGSHTFPQCQDAISCRDTSPVEYQFPTNTSAEGMRTRFANGVEMILSLSVGQCGVKYEGTEGWVNVADGQLSVSKPSLMSDYVKIVADYRERTGRRDDHKRDLLDCIRSRRLTVADAELTARSMASIQIANICMWLKRDMKWDPIKEEFINDEAANRMRSRAQREPWAFV
jgi:predicted dehydrogenase